MGQLVLAYRPTCPHLRADLSRSELSAGRVVRDSVLHTCTNVRTVQILTFTKCKQITILFLTQIWQLKIHHCMLQCIYKNKTNSYKHDEEEKWTSKLKEKIQVWNCLPTEMCNVYRCNLLNSTHLFYLWTFIRKSVCIQKIKCGGFIL